MGANTASERQFPCPFCTFSLFAYFLGSSLEAVGADGIPCEVVRKCPLVERPCAIDTPKKMNDQGGD